MGCKNFAHPNLPDKNNMSKSPKLLDQVRDKLRVKHYAIALSKAKLCWLDQRYIYFHGKIHPKDLATQDITGLCCPIKG
jgi:hypothetical protein